MNIRNTIVFSFFLHTLFLYAALLSARHIVSGERIFVVELQDDHVTETAKAGNHIPELKEEVKKKLGGTLPRKGKSVVALQPPGKGIEKTRENDAMEVHLERSPDEEKKGEAAFPGGTVTARAGPGESGPSSTFEQGGGGGSGSSASITVEFHGSGTGDHSFIPRIKEAIERAKIYPALARKRKQEGIVVTEFSINPKGMPENIMVTRSSGFSLLDSAAKDTIVRAAPFPVVVGRIEAPINFVLK